MRCSGLIAAGLSLATVATAIAIVLGFAIQIAGRWRLGPLERICINLSRSGYALPGLVLAAVPDDWHGVASGYSSESVRFPILAGIEEHRRMTLIVDPGGVVRHVGLRRSARETVIGLTPADFATSANVTRPVARRRSGSVMT